MGSVAFAADDTAAGDTIWIKNGSYVYKSADANSDSHKLVGSHEVTVKNIINDESGVPIWYEISYNDFWGYLIRDYKYVQVENTSVEEPTDEPVSDTEVVVDGAVVTLDGAPEGAKLLVTAASEEKEAVSDDIAKNAVSYDPTLFKEGESFIKTFDISVEKDGADWQPSESDSVSVTLDLGVDWLNAKTYLYVIHILDSVEAINSAEEKYMFFGSDLKNLYPEAAAAAEAAGYFEDTVVYTIMSPETGEVSYDYSGKITIQATSFSDYIVLANNVDDSEYLADTPDVGLKLNKSATFDKATNKGTVTLESYVKGSVDSTPVDVVLIIDHSGSMWTAVNPGNAGMMTLSQLDPEKGTRNGYYVAFEKNKRSDGKYYGFRVHYKNGKWVSNGSFETETYDANGNFLGFINSTAGGSTSIEFTGSNAANYIFAISISGALYDALNSFMDEMKYAVDCRVAICTFAGTIKASDGYSIHEKNANDNLLNEKYDYNGSGIFIDKVLTWDSSKNTLTKAQYQNAFENPTTLTGQEILYDSIEKISTNYGNTPTALGLLYARRLFIQAGRSDSQKVAIVFTDGIPSPAYLGARGREEICSHSKEDYYNKTTKKYEGTYLACDYCDLVTVVKNGVTDYGVRTTYVAQATMLKTAQKATVYSIGPKAGKAGVDVLEKIATSENHYYNAGGDDLNQVFKDIAGVIVATSQQVNKDSVVVDYISDSFKLPNDVQKSDIKVYVADYTGTVNGVDQFGTKVPFNDAEIEIDPNTKQVRVTNFDYETNAVTVANDTISGKKLIIEVPIVPEPDFLGGDGVSTNKEIAGIYNVVNNKDVLVDDFNVPTVDVKVKEIVADFKTQDVYLSQQASMPKLLNIGHFTQNGGNWVVNGINNAFVDIVYLVKDSNGKEMTFTIPAGKQISEGIWHSDHGLVPHPMLTDDKTYTISCTVTSVKNPNDPDNRMITSGTATIAVYKPEITFNDSIMELGDTANYNNNGGSVVWKHGDTVASASMLPVPQLEYSYDIPAGQFKADTAVKVTVKAKKDVGAAPDDICVPKDQDITQHVKFYREKCTFNECENLNKKTEVSSTDSSRINFKVHLSNFDLKIEKDGLALDKDENQTTMYRVVGANGFTMDVAIVGNESVTIKGLRSGEYSITELTDWSWRYEAIAPGVDKELGLGTEAPINYAMRTIDSSQAAGGVVTVYFNNSRINNLWLSGDCYDENIFNAFSN